MGLCLAEHRVAMLLQTQSLKSQIQSMADEVYYFWVVGGERYINGCHCILHVWFAVCMGTVDEKHKRSVQRRHVGTPQVGGRCRCNASADLQCSTTH